MPLSHLTDPADINAASNAPATGATRRPQDPPPPGSEDVRTILEGELARIATAGKEVCQLLGMTSTWGSATWEPDTDPENLIPTFTVAVSGDTPTREVIDLVTTRLERAGWNGALLSHEPDLRLDGHHGAHRLTLTASHGVVRLRVSAAPVRLGRTFATWVRAGVYNDDDVSSDTRV